jgi:hypothetical protein
MDAYPESWIRRANCKKDVSHRMTSRGSLGVVVPVYRTPLSDDERVSMRHLEHFLPEAEKTLVMPETLDFGRQGYREERFVPAYFDGLAAYNRFMLSKDFYARFAEYDYILVYQLDAIILSSDIERFLALGVDFLGAPWIAYDGGGAPYLTGVGNGGFSLRRVSAFRRLVESRVPTSTPRDYYRRIYSGAPVGRRLVGLCKAGLKGLGVRNTIRSAIARPFGPEDEFIAAHAESYSPGFALGSIDHALAFAFEREPRFCLKRASGHMPLGAHAWGRYDRSFWEPYLLS